MKPTLKKTLIALIALAFVGGGIFWYRSNVALAPEQRYKLQTLEKGDLTPVSYTHLYVYKRQHLITAGQTGSKVERMKADILAENLIPSTNRRLQLPHC